MKSLAVVLIALALHSCAHEAARSSDVVGRIYSYVRSNRDGSEAERIHVYRGPTMSK